MLYSNGIELRNEQGIFPIVVFQKNIQKFKSIGTTFFINGLGVFVTARHVFNNELHKDNMIFVMQHLSDQRTVNRVVTNLCIHPIADIAVGLVEIARDPMTAKEVEYEIAPNCRLSFRRMENGTELIGFGYPKANEITNANLTTFEFRGRWATGIVNDYYPDGISNLKNKCYQTDMVIDSGCSGGPVFKDGWVVGINSTSFDIGLEGSPLSFITPVEYLLDLQVPFENKLMSIKDMVRIGRVIAEH
jgi:S1-C subfamily serine protease